LIGGMLYLIMITIIIELIKLLFKIKNNNYLAYIIIGLTLFVSIYSYVNTLTYKEETIVITSPKIDDPIKIVQLSDNHLFGAHSKNRFEKAYLKATKQEPNFIVITEDLFDYPGHIPDDTIGIVNNYNTPVFFVYGNHDIMFGEEAVNKIINNTKMNQIASRFNSYREPLSAHKCAVL